MTTAPTPAPILVTGPTGRQGGATVRALSAAGVPVRALVRDATTDRARAVAALGAELVVGDLDDPASLRRAAEGAGGVFSVQHPDFAAWGFQGELDQGVNLIEAARAAGVPHFVHTSVSGAGQHTEWLDERWSAMEPYYATKSALQDRVREAGFAHWTLIKPGYFMENLLPAERVVFPQGVEGGLVTLLRPKTVLSLVAVADIGAAAAAAFTSPERFDGVELELASEKLTVAEVAEVLSRALGTELVAPELTVEEADAAGMPAEGHSQLLLNEHPQPADPKFARALGLRPTSFAEWAREHLRTDG